MGIGSESTRKGREREGGVGIGNESTRKGRQREREGWG